MTVSRVLFFDPSRIDDFMGVKAEVTGDPSAGPFADAHSGTVTWERISVGDRPDQLQAGIWRR